MKHVVPSISALCQLGFFFGAVIVVFDYVAFVGQFESWQDPDPRIFESVQIEEINGLMTLLIGGLIGVLLAWISFRVLGDSPSWFQRFTILLSWLWVPLIPVGTAVGFGMWRWTHSTK